MRDDDLGVSKFPFVPGHEVRERYMRSSNLMMRISDQNLGSITYTLLYCVTFAEEPPGLKGHASLQEDEVHNNQREANMAIPTIWFLQE